MGDNIKLPYNATGKAIWDADKSKYVIIDQEVWCSDGKIRGIRKDLIGQEVNDETFVYHLHDAELSEFISYVNYDFGEAIKALENGKKVCREGWNGKNMFLYYVPANSYPASGNSFGTMKGVFENDMVPYGAYIAMKTAQNNVVPWLASQTDVLAKDWIIL